MTITNTLYQVLNDIPSYQDAFQRVLKLTHQPGRKIIAIAGLPGSGKSTLADYLAIRANHHQQASLVSSVSMDGFHLSKAKLEQFPDPEAAFKRRGAPWTFDSAAFCQSLQQFKQQPTQTLYWPSFDHAIGDPIDNAIVISPDVKVLIVEGLYVLHDDHGFAPSSLYLDQRWFIDMPFDQAMQQLARRHQEVWGFTADQAQAHIDANDALNAKIAYRSRHHANLQISSG